MTNKPKSLIVALAEAKVEHRPELNDMTDWVKTLAHIGAQINGALELAWCRGEHAGYVAGYRAGKAGRKNKWAKQ